MWVGWKEGVWLMRRRWRGRIEGPIFAALVVVVGARGLWRSRVVRRVLEV